MARQRTLRRNSAHLMSTCSEFGEHVGAGVFFELQRIACIGESLAKQKARTGEGSERVHPVVDQPREDRGQRLRLTVGALRAEQQMWPAILQVHAGVERMERPLARLHRVVMPGIRAE